jgi:hypothetical protein
MLNDRSGLWEITSERVALLTRGLPRLGVRDAKTVDAMLFLAKQGERFWSFEAEFLTAVQSLAEIGFKPSNNDIDRVLARTRAGAARDGVYGQQWVSDAISLLEQLRSEDQ